MPMVFTHGSTSKNLLQIDWDYPVYTPPEQPNDGTTRAAVVAKALSLEEAFAAIAGDDQRPLLVLRECPGCAGTDLALLSQRFANERTILLTHWFHCVKLSATVMQENHAFHNLFPDHKTHLFLSRNDGSERIDLDGQQSQGATWKAMSGLLRQTYAGSPEGSVRELLKLLAQFDVIDEQESQLLKELDQELERRGAKSPRVRKLQESLKDLGKKRADLTAAEKELRELQFKATEAAAAGTDK